MASVVGAWQVGASIFNKVESIGAAAGAAAQLGQSHVHQRESIQWQRRSYRLDSQSVRLDALDHAKEEIKSHYDTYVGRTDTLLLMLALIFPFALNVIQFSDPFVPNTPEECPDCIETEYSFIVIVWAVLIGVILVLPFWGILMMIRCKQRLDRWLEYSLAGLHSKRREIVSASDPSHHHHHHHDGASDDEASHIQETEQTEQTVFDLVNKVLMYQEIMAKNWNSELGRLVHVSTMLLWLSAGSALLLTALSMWIYLVNKGGQHTVAGYCFAAIIIVGCSGPVLYLVWQHIRFEVKAEVLGADFAEDVICADTFPLAQGAGVPWRRPITAAQAAVDKVTHLFGHPDDEAGRPVINGSSRPAIDSNGGMALGFPFGLWCPGRRQRHERRPRARYDSPGNPAAFSGTSVGSQKSCASGADVSAAGWAPWRPGSSGAAFPTSPRPAQGGGSPARHAGGSFEEPLLRQTRGQRLR